MKLMWYLFAKVLFPHCKPGFTIPGSKFPRVEATKLVDLFEDRTKQVRDEKAFQAHFNNLNLSKERCFYSKVHCLIITTVIARHRSHITKLSKQTGG